MAPDDRKVKCTTRLGALDVPRNSAHKPEEFVGFRTLFGCLFVRPRLDCLTPTLQGLSLCRKFQRRFVDSIGRLYR